MNLHGFYSGIERLFELIAAQVDEATPAGESWHRQLVEQMAKEIAAVRPPVIAPQTVSALDEFRKFRHLVRNVYTVNLNPERMQSLLTTLPTLWTRLKDDFIAFADFLDQVSNANEED